MVGMKKIDKEQMALGYVEMAKINLEISESYMQLEGKEYLEKEAGM
jgi:hypothetical protein